MSSAISNLEPAVIWQQFSALNAIPRASKREDRIIQFMLDFGLKLGLSSSKDHVGNVIICKPASPGMEDRKKVVVQAHLDMVHQKNNDTLFDFDKEGIRMFVDGDWVKAEGTTLGADNGLGVASIMALLAVNDIVHPALEALFTIDEETGMTGAKGLQAGVLTGDILLNLDTEEDDEIGVGCAGGVDVTAIKSFKAEQISADYAAFELLVNGLQGGHSGMEIHKGLGNANKIINRVLSALQTVGIRISRIEGGGLRNAIPRESKATIWIPLHHSADAHIIVEQQAQEIKAELETVDKGLQIALNTTEASTAVLPAQLQRSLINSLYAAPNGVYRMSADFDNLVETSNNIASVQVKDEKITIKCLTRSSVESAKYDLANALKASFELMDATVTFEGDYPGWKPDVQSAILQVLRKTYVDLFAREPAVLACHAGLECGILRTHYPQMEMISFGPTIRGAHSPQECVSISSVQKFWQFLLEILKNIPQK